RETVRGPRAAQANAHQVPLPVGAGQEGAAPAAVSRDDPRMRAVLCRAWGEVDDLRVEEVPTPAPGPGEVLIAVKATAVNYAAGLMAPGRYQTKPNLPFSPGPETAGGAA